MIALVFRGGFTVKRRINHSLIGATVSGQINCVSRHGSDHVAIVFVLVLDGERQFDANCVQCQVCKLAGPGYRLRDRHAYGQLIINLWHPWYVRLILRSTPPVPDNTGEIVTAVSVSQRCIIEENLLCRQFALNFAFGNSQQHF